MGKIEKYQKELDFILEKLKFWRYVIFAIVSGVVGILFSISQNKININLGIVLLLFFALMGVVISIKRINDLINKYLYFLELLEKEE